MNIKSIGQNNVYISPPVGGEVNGILDTNGPEIPTEIKILQSQVISLKNSINELNEKLGPVLRVSTSPKLQFGSSITKDTGFEPSSLTLELRDISKSLFEATGDISDIINKLAL